MNAQLDEASVLSSQPPAARRAWGRFALVALAVVLLCMELGARWVVNTSGVVIPGALGIQDAQLGWSYRPHMSEVSNRTGRSIEYRTNAHGQRGPERSFDKAPGVYRIVLSGQSWAFGFGVTEDECYVHLLEQYLQNVEIVNVSVGAFGADQDYLVLKNEAYKYHPDLVIMHEPHYDEARHMKAKYGSKGDKPWYTVEDGKLVLHGQPVPVAPPSAWNDVDHELKRWSKLYEVAASMVFVATAHPPTREEITATDLKNLQDPVYRKNLDEIPRLLVQAAQADAQSQGAKFVLVSGIRTLTQDARQDGITVIDTVPVMDNPDFPLPDGLAHLSPSGHGALAWELARQLHALGVIPEEHWRSHTPVAPAAP